MKGLGRINVLLRRFPSNPTVAATMRKATGRPSLAGTPYVPLDPIAWRMILIGALIYAVEFFAMEGTLLLLLWLLVLGPVSVGTVCLIARLVNRTWFSRALAGLYLAGSLVLIGVAISY